MNEYVKQAQDFLTSCSATMEIAYTGMELNSNWKDKELKNTYFATITTPRGTMKVKFWDSVYNTEREIKPTEYDILACLEKYDVGTFEDFVNEFGYDVSEPDNLRCAKRIYKAVTHEHQNLCRCFTEEQLESLREIQ